jgi:hypothetical protein
LSDEFHVSTISYGNEQELTEKILLEAKVDVDKYVDKKLVNEVLDDLALKSTELFKKIDLLKNLTAAEKTTLQNLLKSDADLAKAFANAPEEMAGAWKLVRSSIAEGTLFAKDPKALKKLAEMMQPNSALRQKLGSNWEAKLSEALDRNRHLNCNGCGGTFNRGPKMHEFLSDFEFINLHFDETSDIGKRLHQWSKRKYLNGNEIPIGSGHISESHQFLNFLRKKNIKEVDIKNIDGAFFDDVATSKKYDIELKQGPTFYFELKNKNFLGMQNLDAHDISQVLGANGAFSKISKLEEYNWVAYLERFGENANSNTAEAHLKDLWKKVFENRKTEVFNAMNTELRESILGQGNALRFDLFEQAISNTNSNLYKFIKAK